jgi:hypothetical protein
MSNSDWEKLWEKIQSDFNESEKPFVKKTLEEIDVISNQRFNPTRRDSKS